MSSDTVKNRFRRLARNTAMHAYSHMVLPRMYRDEAQIEAEPNHVNVVVVSSGSQYMGPTASALLEELEKYDLTMTFLGFTERESYGYAGWKETCLKAVSVVTHCAAVISVGETPLSFTGLAHEDRFFQLPDNSPIEQIELTSRMVANYIGVDLKPPVEERMQRICGEGPDISFVVPAHNAATTIERTIRSIASQDYPLERMEVVAVDDGSSDATWNILQSLVAEFPNLLRTEQLDSTSGTPAAPRNLGLSHARGEYVFFLDADDWISPQAVRKMLGHALDWNSDILLVKMKGHGSREVPKSMFRVNQPEVDIWRSKVMWTFAPLKLFRRSLVNEIRFPENCMPEDISFVLRAYVDAEVVSVAADYDYYHVEAARGNSNASVMTWSDVESNLRAYEDLFGFISNGSHELRECKTLLCRLFGRDVANTLRRIDTMQDRELADNLQKKLLEICTSTYNEDTLKALPEPERELIKQAFSNPVE